jgi:hypothetical protein
MSTAPTSVAWAPGQSGRARSSSKVASAAVTLLSCALGADHVATAEAPAQKPLPPRKGMNMHPFC